MNITSLITSALIVFAAIVLPMPALAAVDGSFDTESLTTEKTKPTITGEASGKKMRLLIEDEDGKDFYKKDRSVKNGEWSAKLTKKLKLGTYDASLYVYDGRKRVLVATSTLEIGEKGAGALSVSQLPLLMGGNAAPGSSVPVAYVKIANTSKATTTIEGITLIENGSANDSLVVGFSTSDDKGGSRTTVDSTFKKGSAFVPLAATIEPGKVRIFTIKAILAKISGLESGKQLKIDVSGIRSDAKVSGKFPLRGTTFTLTK